MQCNVLQLQNEKSVTANRSLMNSGLIKPLYIDEANNIQSNGIFRIYSKIS